MDPRERYERSVDEFAKSDTTTETFERNLAAAQCQLLTYGLQLMYLVAVSGRDMENAT